VTDELIDLEREGWRALSGPDGADHYDALLTQDALMVFAVGVLDRAGSLAAIRAADPWRTVELGEFRVIRPTPDLGIVCYHAVASRNGHGPYRAWITSLYMRSADTSWRLAFHQQTPI
jgi:hypothetical protein